MNIDRILLYFFIFIVLYQLFNKTEKMSNEDISKKINEIYKADIGSIRNLSKLANDLTKNGKLIVPGGLEVKGNITADGTGTFGNAKIGTWIAGKAEYATFAHKDRFSTTNDYSLLHHKDGNTYLNAKSGKTVHLRINNSDGLIVDSNKNVDAKGQLIARGNVDTKGTLIARGKFDCYGVSSFKNQKKNSWSHINWSDGQVYLRGNVRIDGAGGTGKNLYVDNKSVIRYGSVIYLKTGRGRYVGNKENDGGKNSWERLKVEA